MQRDYVHQEQRLEEILFSNSDPATKSRHITALGFDPEMADEIVERHLEGIHAPVYYERLDFADLDDLDEVVDVDDEESAKDGSSA